MFKITNSKNSILQGQQKKLVTRLPNFPDRRIRYEFSFKKYRHKQKNKFLEFFNFFKVRGGVGEEVAFFIIL